MAVKLTLEFPGVVPVLESVGTDASKSLTRGMERVVNSWKKEIRAAVKAGFKRTPIHAKRRGLNFEKSFQGTTFPTRKSKKFSFNPAGFLYAKAAFAESFEEGDTITAGRRRKYLAIALRGAKKLKLDYKETGRGGYGKRSAVEEASANYGPLRPVPTKSGDIILAASADRVASAGLKPRGRKRNFVPLFLLVKRVKVPKRLSFIRFAQRALDRLPRETTKEIEIQSRRSS